MLHNAPMITLQRYLKHERLYAALLIATLLMINNTINATSILMEANMSGASIPPLQPFITEYSSALATLALFPLILWLVDRFPFRWGVIGRNAVCHLGFSALYCLAHIALFVLLRKFLFDLQSLEYRFTDNWLLSFVYEYRKDAWSYAVLVAGIYSYRFTLSRLRGEAVPVAAGEDSPAEQNAPERFLVRKLGREFVVRASDVEWLEAAGNYVNLHVGERTYPLRATMARLVENLEDSGFARIHRSRGVNLDYVESITPLESGDCTVTLKNGTDLSLSRRYRDALRQQLRQHSGV
jgi:hypothetical protein